MFLSEIGMKAQISTKAKEVRKRKKMPPRMM
jgi:hypothetical protein